MAGKLNFTIGRLLEDTARRCPGNEALVYPDRKLCYSYQALNAACDRLAKGLMALGIKKGEHVAIWATNVPEWVLLQFATAKIGAVLVTINTLYKSRELEYILRQSEATTLFMIRGFKDTNYIDTFLQIAPGFLDKDLDCPSTESLPFLQRAIFIGDETPQGMMNFAEIGKLGQRVTDQEYGARQAQLNEQDVINMQYTSGTTGFPKGVMLSHYNIINNAFSIGECMKFTESDRLCIPVPFFHCFGCVLGVLACVTHGSAMVPVEAFKADKVLQTIEAGKCTAVHGVPTMFIAELEEPDFHRFDLSSLRTGIMAGAPCPMEIMRRVMTEMHANEITIAYGLTEASPVITQSRTDDSVEIRVTTVGRALPDVEVKIVDIDTGRELPPGRQGELWTRGYLVMKGYFHMPEETATAIDQAGWLHTGDLAIMDEKGYCRITGRLKDMIIRGGENIYPREIEEYLYTHPKIMDVQVFGVPDNKYGEQVMAAIKLHAGVKATAEEIREFCRGRIANHKIPIYVTFVDDYPMTASGKVQKFKLRERAVRELNLLT
ncbi:MAG: AMP-binding protein [Deltaproteobacteria bacterium]|nr:AMP-binding protein [Deltaproteobacteria bacterium]